MRVRVRLRLTRRVGSWVMAHERVGVRLRFGMCGTRCSCDPGACEAIRCRIQGMGERQGCVRGCSNFVGIGRSVGKLDNPLTLCVHTVNIASGGTY